MDGQYKYILRLEGEYQEPENKRDIAEYDSPDEAVEAGLFYINEANEFLGDVKSDWMLLESDLKDGKFVAKRDMPDPQPCIYLKSIKVKKKDNTSTRKDAHYLGRLIRIANELDRRGLTKEADDLDLIILTKLSGYKHPAYPGDPGDSYIRELSERLTDLDQNIGGSTDWMQAAFAALGLIPLYGEPFDVLNTAIYTIREKPIDAILSAISVIPIYGDAVGKGTQLLLLAINNGHKAINFGNKTYTVAGLATFVKDHMEKINEPEVKALLEEIDKKTGQRKGTLYGMYVKDIKETVYNAASGKVSA